MKIIETDRLILRLWKQEDAVEYYKINLYPKVTEFLLGPITIEQSEKFITNQNEIFSRFRYMLFAV